MDTKIFVKICPCGENKKYDSRMCCLVTLIKIIAKLGSNTNLCNQSNHGNRKINGNIHHSNHSSRVNIATTEISVTFVMLLMKSNTKVCFHIKFLLILSDCNQNRIYSTDFSKNPENKISLNLSTGSHVVPLGLTGRQTDTMKLTVTFRNFVNVPKSVYSDRNTG
jgi:hypothetical protein